MREQKPHIILSQETKSKLDNLGSKNETYEDIILRLIKQSRRYKK